MATIRPRHHHTPFYRLLGRWFYAQARLPEAQRSPPPSRREAGWWQAPRNLVHFLRINGCELDELRGIRWLLFQLRHARQRS
jgi:hypothetical protein